VTLGGVGTWICTGGGVGRGTETGGSLEGTAFGSEEVIVSTVEAASFSKLAEAEGAEAKRMGSINAPVSHARHLLLRKARFFGISSTLFRSYPKFWTNIP
jgi:hypothetical protein